MQCSRGNGQAAQLEVAGDLEGAYRVFARCQQPLEPQAAAGALHLLARLSRGEGQQAAERVRRSGLRSRQAAPRRAPPRLLLASDLHVDQASSGGQGWAQRVSSTAFLHDVLLLAGDLADSPLAARQALALLRPKFLRVFYVPGNHELWLRPQDNQRVHGDSFCQLMELLKMCDELDVDTLPAQVAPGLVVVPLLSWYCHTFDVSDPRPGRLRFDKFCCWPCSDLDVWQVFLRLNQPRLALARKLVAEAVARPNGAVAHSGAATASSTTPKVEGTSDVTVVTLSHFLPHPGLPFSGGVPELAKGVGCLELGLQLDQVGSQLHVYGHTHINTDLRLGPVAGGTSLARRYVQFVPSGEHRSGDQIHCLWDGTKLVSQRLPCAPPPAGGDK